MRVRDRWSQFPLQKLTPKWGTRWLKNRSKNDPRNSIESKAVSDAIWRCFFLNFEASMKVKNLQNHVRGVRNQTLRVCDIERYQTQFEHGLEVKKLTKNGPKIVQKFTKVDQHSHRTTRDADDGRKSGARRTHDGRFCRAR